MSHGTPKYEFELWINGVRVADITRLVTNRHFVLTRNLAPQLSFNMSLTAWEEYCASVGAAPQALLEADVTDIYVKRNGAYYFGVQVVDMTFSLNESGISLEVRAVGYFDMLKDRYITKNYDGEERTTIARDMITTTQAGDSSNDFGITMGPIQYDTGFSDTERDYVDQNVRDGIVNLSQLSEGSFDFDITYDKQFNTYEQIGSDRPTYKFTYPYNIRSGTVPHTAQNLWNYIIALGSGFGEEALRTETADGESRANYKTRQKIVSFNSVTVQDTLDKNAYAYLQRVKEILELPKFNISGALADLDILGVGDRIPVEVKDHPALPLSGTYRIEQLDVTVDDNDAEDISVTIDNYGL